MNGGWHFLGACEPEEVLDKGWFTNASSRAMIPFIPGGFLTMERMEQGIEKTALEKMAVCGFTM